MTDYQYILKILTLLGGKAYVYSSTQCWKILRFARTDLAVNRTATWYDSWKQTNLDLYGEPDIKKETAYENCVDCRFELTPENTIMLIIILHDGDYHGERTRVNCTFTLEFLPDNKYDFTEVKGILCNKLEALAERKIEQEDHDAHLLRVQNKMKQLLGI